MASDGQTVKLPAISLVHGSQAPTTVTVPGGKILPHSGHAVAARSAGAAELPKDLQAQVTLLNKFLNDSGKPNQFRVVPSSDNKLIEEINPANGEVIGEFSAAEFPALAKSLGISGALIDRLA